MEQDYPIIAGKAAGRKVSINPALHPAYQRLEQAALRGNHWASIAVRELNALTSGVVGKNNVYIRPYGPKDAAGNTGYIVFLPGLKATLYPTVLGSYCVTDLVLDANYFEATADEESGKRTGLYRVIPEGAIETWKTEYVEDGNIEAKNGRLVVIADSGYKSASNAARTIVPRAMEFPQVPEITVLQEGCDLHFTAGQKQLGGMIRYNPLSVDSSRGSALHLATTMEQARTLKNVIWAADQGGSAVLTQAMQILANKGVTLKSHTAYLYKPRTSPAAALKLAHKLELSLGKSFANTGWDPQGALSQLSVAGRRLNNSNDRYNKAYHTHAWINGLAKAAGPIGLGSGAAAAMGVSIPMIGGIVAAISGGSVVYALGQSLVEDLRTKFKR